MNRFVLNLALSSWLIIAALIPSAAAADVAAAKPLAIDTLFSHARYGRAELSPDTKRLATTAKVGERMRLVVVDLDARIAKPIAGFDDADVLSANWINDRRLVFTVGDLQETVSEQPGGGLYAINADGSDFRELVPTLKKQINSAAMITVGKIASYLARIRGSDDILILKQDVTQHGARKGFHVMRQDSRTGREQSLVMGVSGRIVDAHADAAGELRAVQSIDSDGRVLLWHRAGAESPWVEVARFASLQAPDRLAPVGFSPDGRTMWVSGRVNRDTAAIYAFDLGAKKLGEKVLAHPGADIEGGLKFDRETGELLGIVVDAGKPQASWFDEEWARVQATVDKTLPNTFNALSGNVKSRILVHATSDREPGRYYLFDVQKRTLAETLALRPDIAAAQLSQTQLIHYPAADKLDIPAYLTLPPTGATKGLPLVVLAHGGPYMRDHWRFDPEVQFLASRGYAVLQPQFRGSTGFGDRHFRAGWKTWGLAMQDDLSEGVRHLVKQGTADPKRVCIMGTSYGGYVAMMGLAKDPDLYRCGVSFAGVSDIDLLFSVGWSDFANSLWADFGMKELIGDPDQMKEQFAATSPVRQAARIKSPLLLIHASEDYRVPVIHAEKMRDAMKAANKSFDWLIHTGEGHGLMKQENRIKHFRTIEAFLARHLGGTVAEAVKAN